jgi:hypothetical protein
MMKRFYAAILVSCFFAISCFAQDAKKPEQAGPSEYAVLLTKVQGGDLSIDFQKLRFSFMESPERKQAPGTSAEDRLMWKAFNAQDYKEAIKNADVVLASEFVNLDAHFVESTSYDKLGDGKQSGFHRAVFAGLLKSITDSGDGKSIKTAYVVIKVHEEYVVLNVMGLKLVSQALMVADGHSYDRLDTTDPKTNQTVTLFFNVDTPMKQF